MKIFLGSDHAGFELKKAVIEALQSWDHQAEDLGTLDTQSTDYPDYAHQVAQQVLATEGALGILICGTGLGMSMAANRHQGIRAAVCHDVFSAKSTRQHNNANILCMGQRVIGVGSALEVLKAFLEASFEGGRHERRVHKIER